jgi:hypothetical protein
VRFRLLALATLLLASCAQAPVGATPDPYLDRPHTSDGPNAPRVRATPEISPTPTQVAVFKPTPLPTRDPLAVVGDRLTVASGDFDCDGLPDQLEFFTLLGAATPALPTLARLTTGTGAVHELAIEGQPNAGPLGITDVNGDGCDDAIIVVGRGASTTWTSFLVYDGTDLRQVEENGVPVMFLFGGSVRHGNAIECRRTKDAPEIIARAVGDYTSAYAWDLVEDVHRWSTKSRLVLWSTTRGVIPVGTPYAMPADSDRYWGLDCGALKLAN